MRPFVGPAFYAFDLDGVLIDSHGLHDQAFGASLEALGEFDLAQMYSMLTKQEPLEALSTRAKLARLGRAELYDAVKPVKDEAFIALIQQIRYSRWAPIDLHRVRRLAPIALVTSCTQAVALRILEHAHLAPEDFDAFVAPANPEEPTKPHPHLYERAKDAIAMLDRGASNFWYGFEDSPAGLTAVAAAGGIPIRTTFNEIMERLRLCAF